jgi:hypothetical protein
MTDQRLREAADKLEIYDVLARYCRGLDRLDPELVRSVYHEDAMDHHGPFDKLGQEFAPDVVALVRENTDSAMHFLSNVSIELRGEVAWVESYMLALNSHAGNYQDVGARLVDRFERRDGAWKIADRLMILEFVRETPMGPPSPLLGMFSRGSRDAADPSYKR